MTPWLAAQIMIAEQIGDYHTAASIRWADHNANQPRICSCGAPSTLVIAAPDGYMGSVAPEFHRCAAHADVGLGVPWVDGVPQYGQSREGCTWRTWNSYVGRVIECGCGTHVGDTAYELPVYPPDGSP